MKKVLISQEILLADDVRSSRYYGINLENNINYKGFITRKGYHHGNFFPAAAEGITNANYWSSWSNPSLPELIKDLIKNDFNVYEFESARELFAWVGKIENGIAE